MPFAQIIVKNTLSGEDRNDRIFTYRIPEGLSVGFGQMVRVPFGAGNRLCEGFVLDVMEETSIPQSRLKNILEVLTAAPVFSERELSLARWIAEQTLSSLSAALTLFVPRVPERIDETVELLFPSDPEAISEKTGLGGARLGEKQRLLLEAVRKEPGRALSDVLRETGTQRSTVRSLQDRGLLSVQSVLRRDWKRPHPMRPALPEGTVHELNLEQEMAYRAVREALIQRQSRTFLLYGVTGSGKTEVYLQLIEETLQNGRDAFLLVPEIGLTPQLIERVRERFGDEAVLLHSRLNDTERSRLWNEVRQGLHRVVVGPRSALFAPLPDPGLVILDEEHELSYKSDHQPRFQTGDVAEEMSRRGCFPVIRGSATPSVESMYAAKTGRYTLLRLNRRAVEGASLPRIELVDMRMELTEGNRSPFSRRLTKAIHECLERKEQAILLLNRKGYASFVSCRSCGFVLRCPNCFLPYTYHKEGDRLICHHCGKQVRPVRLCPSCGSRYIRYFGSGTQRIEETVSEIFPQARVLRMDADTTSTKHGFEEAYAKIRDHEADLVVGTQMIAKGLDMPRVTLVGVLSADQTLFFPDYHSTERTFQLLTQASGRAGRGENPGQVFIQTYDPDHYVLQAVASRDHERFYEQELLGRRMMHCPPYRGLSQLLISDKDPEKVQKAASRMKEILQEEAPGSEEPETFDLLGPTPAELGRIDSVFRWKLLIRSSNEEKMRQRIARSLARFEKERTGVQVTPDIHPMVML